MKEPYPSIDHGDLLYDEKGLPKWYSTAQRSALSDAVALAEVIDRAEVCRVSAVETFPGWYYSTVTDFARFLG